MVRGAKSMQPLHLAYPTLIYRDDAITQFQESRAKFWET